MTRGALIGWTAIGTAISLTLTACGDGSQQQMNAEANMAGPENTGETNDTAMNNGMAAMVPVPSAQEFVDQAAKNDAFEIAAAELATKNAASSEVKAFAAEMTKAHTASTEKIKGAAAQAQPAVTPNPALMPDQEENLNALKGLTGAKFDAAYMAGQVEAHEKALALMRSYAADGQAAPLKTAAGEISQVVEGHLTMAKDLNSKLSQ